MTERQQFESWWRTIMNVENMSLDRCETYDGYLCHETNRAYMAWQARAQVALMKEPVAWLQRSKTGLVRTAWTVPPTAEQVAIAECDGDTITPLYTAPAQTVAPVGLGEQAGWCYPTRGRTRFFDCGDTASAEQVKDARPVYYVVAQDEQVEPVWIIKLRRCCFQR